MINAEDAYEKAKMAKEKRKRKLEREDDRDVKKAIKRAIKDGDYEVEVRDISKKLISKLEAKQYLIVAQKHFHTGVIMGYMIKWGE